jgi:hypothetical protein
VFLVYKIINNYYKEKPSIKNGLPDNSEGKDSRERKKG